MTGLLKAVSKKKRLVTRTFRMEDDIDTVLEEESTRQFLSVNALVNKILRRYVDFGRFAERHEASHFFHSDLLAFMERLDDSDMEWLGRKLGEVSPVAILNLFGREVAFESLPFLIEEVLARYHRWFKAEKKIEEDRYRYSLRHDLGPKWSIFLKNYFEATLREHFKAKGQVEIMEDIVVCAFSA